MSFQTSIRLDDDAQRHLQVLKDLTGAKTTTEAIHSAIKIGVKETLRAYVEKLDPELSQETLKTLTLEEIL